MRPLDPQKLVSLVQRYYPHDLLDPNFRMSPERKAFDEVWARAMREDHDRWHQTVTAIREALPGITVADTTAPNTCGSFPCVAHVKEQLLIGGARIDTMVIAYRSVLAPAYGLAWAQHLVVPRRAIADITTPWQGASTEIPEELQPFAEIMSKQIERDYGIQRLPIELARLRVPGIFVECIPIGEATLFDALFSSDRLNMP